MLTYISLGSTKEIGSSCHYLSINNRGILLDVGLDPNLEGIKGLPDFSPLRLRSRWSLDHAIITHAHHDHMGALPVLIKQFPHTLVHSSKATIELLNLLLPASAKLQRRKRKEGTTNELPLFSLEQANSLAYLYEPHLVGKPFVLSSATNGNEITCTFLDSGHILGAFSVLLKTKTDGNPFNIYYTSDIKLENQFVQPSANLPDEKIDVLLLETTLGADALAEDANRESEVEKFLSLVQATLRCGGSILIPVFALGRAQEILSLLDRFKKQRKIPQQTPLYTAGTMRGIAQIYDATRFSTPRLNNEVQFSQIPQFRLPRKRDAIAKLLHTPSIYVLGSGMMFEKTDSNEVAQLLVENQNNAIALVGYAKPESPARHLIEAFEHIETEIQLSKEKGKQPLNCTVSRFKFSGHSHRRALLKMIGKLKPEMIILVHGDSDARTWMYDNIKYFYPEIEVFQPQEGIPIVFKSEKNLA